MYNARVGIYYDKRGTRYFFHNDVKDARCVFIDDSNMLDIDTKEVYPVVPRNNRGYISKDIELNKKCVISYEKTKKIDYETLCKSINAKIDYYMENNYLDIINRVKERECESLDKKYQSKVDKNLKEIIKDSVVESLTAHYEKEFFLMDCERLEKQLKEVREEAKAYYSKIELDDNCNTAVRKVKELERKIKFHYKKG